MRPARAGRSGQPGGEPACVTRATLRNAAIAVGLVAVAAGGYVGLRASSAFSVDEVRVEGGSATTQEAVAAEVRAAVGERSLLDLDADAIVAQLRALPAIQDASVDRAFPHRLDVRITPRCPWDGCRPAAATPSSPARAAW